MSEGKDDSLEAIEICPLSRSLILSPVSDSIESCSRTTSREVISRMTNHKFILPKGSVPIMERNCEDSSQLGYVISLSSDDVMISNPVLSKHNTKVAKSSGQSSTRTMSECCVCGTESESYVDVHDDMATEDGNSFHDVLVSVLDNGRAEECHQYDSAVLCDTCAELVARIDRYRIQLDRDCSQLRDLYQSGQDMMEEDLLGSDDSVRPCDVISQLVGNQALECKVLDVSQGVVAGHVKSSDLCCPVLETHILKVQQSASSDNNTATLYCTPREWSEYLSCQELSLLFSGCIMSPEQNSNPKLFVLSQKILECVSVEMEQEQECPFLFCSECDRAFDKVHLLVGHIQHTHPSTGDAEGHNKLPSDDNNGVIIIAEKTGEKPSIEKPFQCDKCEKCFGNYSNMMSHVEHYHGWSRQCNVPGCEVELSNIADFVTHHVRHSDPGFVVPDSNHDRNSVSCQCPICQKVSYGVNRYWEHSFIHDSVPRFKCPLCDRRVNKVQNLKDHIKRHLGPESKTKECELCKKKFCPADIYKHMKTVHGKQDSKYNCDICGKTFSQLHKLEHHSLSHN